MAAFYLIRDADAERRSRAVVAATMRLGEFDGLTVDSHDAGPLSLVWGVLPGAPFDRASLDNRHALIMGEALAEAASKRTTAVEHLGSIAAGGRPVYDGFHAAVAYDDTGTFEVSVDLLGMMPLYYVTLADVVLVATSSSLFHLHLLFRGALDPFGLAAVLATNGLIAGRTLYRDVRRLDQGHALIGGASGAPKEEQRYVLPVTDELHEAPLAVCAHEMHEALRSVCRRHVPAGVPHSLMLSGGLDSRLLAGVLAREGRPITAITRGRPSDIEYRCAHEVAKHLGFEHHLVPHVEQSLDAFPAAIQWEGLTTSPGTGASGSGAAALRRFHPLALTGYLGTSLLGGSHIDWREKPGTPPRGLEWAWWRVANWGLPLDVLERLVRRDVFGDAVREVRSTFDALYAAAGDTEYQRTNRFGLLYRQRFGTGDVLTSLSFGAWPVCPQIDRELIRVSGSIAPAVLEGRAVQRHIMEHDYLGLACLPLDRNSFDTRPIVPRMSHLIGHALARDVRGIRRQLGMRDETRYYVRTYDINGDHWRLVRRMVEPFRERAYSVFERDAFDALVPPPDVDVPARDGIQDVSGLKTLLAFLLMQPFLMES